jgi:nicotinamide mononucleotide transporter
MEGFGISLNQIAEIGIVVCSLLYLGLIACERRAGWWFGVIASLVSVWLFIRVNLLAESLLYVYYVIVGVYGFFHWKYGGDGDRALPVTTRSWGFHLTVLVCGTILVVATARGLAFLGSERVYLDATTTVFSVITTWMVARKILENWIYWIVIDALSVWLYLERSLPIYAVLMGVYTVLAAVGFWVWKRRLGSTGGKEAVP